jgi:hypothetical protein
MRPGRTRMEQQANWQTSAGSRLRGCGSPHMMETSLGLADGMEP